MTSLPAIGASLIDDVGRVAGRVTQKLPELKPDTFIKSAVNSENVVAAEVTPHVKNVLEQIPIPGNAYAGAKIAKPPKRPTASVEPLPFETVDGGPLPSSELIQGLNAKLEQLGL